MKLALAHDWLNQIGGAEDVLDALARHYPASPIYTSIYAPQTMPEHYRNWDIRALWTDKLPAIQRRHQIYLPLYPLAWNNLRLNEYDVILSNKSGFCHGLQFDARALHICYCLAPTRYVWQLDEYLAGEQLPPTRRPADQAAGRAAPPLGLRRRAARVALRGDQRRHKGTRPPLLQSRLRSDIPTRRYRAFSARRA